MVFSITDGSYKYIICKYILKLYIINSVIYINYLSFRLGVTACLTPIVGDQVHWGFTFIITNILGIEYQKKECIDTFIYTLYILYIYKKIYS